MYSEFQAMGVKVLSVSVDSRFVHKIWQEEELSKMVEGGVPFPMLSDSGGRIGTAYGIYDEAAGVDIRGRFLIDPEGTIRAMEVLTPEVGRNVSELIRQVKAFQHVVATGEVTPSGWQPGSPTLKPRPALTGKVWKEWKPEMVYK
jgi:peroxiredoxin (alkyl hydroperoxide reductase subunit C)